MPSDELHFKLLRLLEEDPTRSQRALARELGISVGGTNHALRALLARGWVKAQNFTRSGNKRGYLYKLTPSGVSEKARLAYYFLQRKRAEHEALMAEIEQLRAEVGRQERD
ncbi:MULTISPECIES: MarR family EPS-associated transcriptional regulator [unclassified Thioalkalivibrio]|uniref:MarR family EPS-associated transcriptional regulator n=1 Tax=unclassified Thioalkalivibrio TaxID=2621013 RepID=UPI00035D8867|nr:MULTISPECIES: MarR family EPS-associated transcriptional regulator [unclassified Thioalkalivibrio]